MKKARVAEPLNKLINAVAVDTDTGRNEICFKVSGKKRGTVGVAVHNAEKKGFLSGLIRRKGTLRYIRIATGRSVDILDMEVDCQDIQSEVEYRVKLRFNVQTPEKDDKSALQKMVEVFADTVPEYPAKNHDDPESGPSSRFRSEMRQWLAKRYRSGDRIKTTEAWRNEQAAEINDYIVKEYGLDAKVKLSLKTISKKRLKPIEVLVETCSCDSTIEIELPITVGCELLDGNKDLFEAVTLSDQDLADLVVKRVDRHLRAKVSLQQFRFENEWKNDLEAAIENDLKAVGRTITNIYFEHSTSTASYAHGPFDIRTDPVDFTPADWREKDKISFVTNAQVSVSNAAVHEPLYEAGDYRDMKGYLHNWFTEALSGAIHECLHEIHDKKVGYAALLTNWESGYQRKIKAKLEALAIKSGLSADAIISNPERPEVRLPQGVWIHIPEDGEAGERPYSEDTAGINTKQFASASPTVKFKLQIAAKVKIKSFEEIKDLLNQTTDALAFIREQLIEPAVRQVCQTTNIIDYYSKFEFGPSGGSEGSFVEAIEIEIKKRFEGYKIELQSLRMNQGDENIREIYSALVGAQPKRIDFTIGALVAGKGIKNTSEAVSVGFDLNVTSVSGQGWAQFVPFIWPQYAHDQKSYYDLVYDKVAQTIGAKFQAGNLELINYAEADEQGKEDFHELVNTYVNEILEQNFGLSGSAITIKRDMNDTEAIVIEERRTTIDLKRAAMKAEKVTILQGLDADEQLSAVREGKRVSDYRNEMDALMPGSEIDRAIEKTTIEDLDSLEDGGVARGRAPRKRNTKREKDVSHDDDVVDASPKDGATAIPPEDDGTEMPPSHGGSDK